MRKIELNDENVDINVTTNTLPSTEVICFVYCIKFLTNLYSTNFFQRRFLNVKLAHGLSISIQWCAGRYSKAGFPKLEGGGGNVTCGFYQSLRCKYYHHNQFPATKNRLTCGPCKFKISSHKSIQVSSTSLQKFSIASEDSLSWS